MLGLEDFLAWLGESSTQSKLSLDKGFSPSVEGISFNSEDELDRVKLESDRSKVL